MAGVIQGFQTGYGIGRDMQDRQYRQEQDEYNKQRQQSLDQQNRDLFEMQVSDYKYRTQRRGVLDGREDEAYQHELNQRPIQESRASALHGLSINQAQVNLDINKEKLSAMKLAQRKGDADTIWKQIYTGAIDTSTGKPRANHDPEVAKQYSKFLNEYSDLPEYQFLKSPEMAVMVRDELNKGELPPIEMFAAMYQGEANKSVGKPARDGGVVARNEITGVEFNEDNTAIRIKMKTYREDGTSYNSYVNNGRNSDSGTGLMDIPVERVIQDINNKSAAGEIALALNKSIGTYTAMNRVQPDKLKPQDAIKELGAVRDSISALQMQLQNTDGENKPQLLNQLYSLQHQEKQLLQLSGLTDLDQQTEQLINSYTGGNEGVSQLVRKFVSEQSASGNQITEAIIADAAQMFKNNPTQSPYKAMADAARGFDSSPTSDPFKALNEQHLVKTMRNENNENTLNFMKGGL